MKTLIKSLILALLVLLPVGCANQSNSVERIGYRSTETLVISVDSAMKVWAGYVVAQERAAAGDPAKLWALAEKETRVRQAYGIYQQAATAIILGQMAAHSQTNTPPSLQVLAGLTVASGPLLTLISDLIK